MRSVDGVASVAAATPPSVVPDWVVHNPLAPHLTAAEHVRAASPHQSFVRGAHEGGKNCWSDLDARTFSLRSASYLTDGVKVPSPDAMFRTVGVNVFKTDKPLLHSARHVAELGDFIEAHPSQFFLVVSWILPGTPSHSVTQLFVRNRLHDDVFEPLFQVRS